MKVVDSFCSTSSTSCVIHVENGMISHIRLYAMNEERMGVYYENRTISVVICDGKILKVMTLIYYQEPLV